MEDVDSASFDVMFDALCNSYRRRILFAASDHNLGTEGEFTPDSLGSDDADNVDLERRKTELYHAHLPELGAADYVEWDPETETIRRGPNFEDIAPLVRLLVEHEDELPGDWP